LQRFNLRKLWFTKGLVKCVKEKNMLYNCFLNKPNSSNQNVHKTYKKKVSHSLRVATPLYYEK